MPIIPTDIAKQTYELMKQLGVFGEPAAKFQSMDGLKGFKVSEIIGDKTPEDSHTTIGGYRVAHRDLAKTLLLNLDRGAITDDDRKLAFKVMDQVFDDLAERGIKPEDLKGGAKGAAFANALRNVKENMGMFAGATITPQQEKRALATAEKAFDGMDDMKAYLLARGPKAPDRLVEGTAVPVKFGVGDERIDVGNTKPSKIDLGIGKPVDESNKHFRPLNTPEIKKEFDMGVKPKSKGLKELF